MVVDSPAAQWPVTVAIVESLLADAVPELAGRPVTALARGWDNTLFRIGDDHVARLPHRPEAESLLLAEQRWLPELAPHLHVAVPVPVHVGEPTAAFAHPWTIVRWQPGVAWATRPDAGARVVDDLGRFLRELAAIAPPTPTPRMDAPPVNPHRGGPLASRAEILERHLAALRDAVDAATLGRIRERWAAVVDAPVPAVAQRWIHGDLHPGNVIVDGPAGEERLGAVIDFGDLTVGDRATDLAIAWMGFDRSTRDRFRDAVGVDDDTWARAAGWALALAVAHLANSADRPDHERIGRRTLAAVLDDG